MGWKTLLKSFLIGAAALFYSCSRPFLAEPVNIYSIYHGDKEMWNHIFEEGEDFYQFESDPFGVIIPHHMIAGYQLAKFYNGLSKVKDPSIIVVVGPNHYENGEANIQTCLQCVYKTNEGDVNLAENYVQKLVEDGIAVNQEDTFVKEHSIHAHTPYIKHYFPDSQVVPIVLQWEMPVAEVKNLSKWLNENLPEDALVIASVDFSHYIPVEAADFHDRSSFASISNFDFKNIYDLELDSPSSIYLILDLMEKRGFKKALRLEHTNLDQFVSEHSDYSTSHQYFAFFKGEKRQVKAVSVMLLGKVLDFGIIDNWNWNRKMRTAEKDVLYHLRGQEDRFLSGSDFLVFEPKEGCEEKKQNGMELRICKKNGKIFLNDIVFSQNSIETKSVKLAVDKDKVVLGMYLTEEDLEIYFFPIDNEKRLLGIIDRQKFFRKIIEKADLEKGITIDYEKNIVKIPR